MADMTGRRAADFAMRDADGQIHRLADFQDKWLLLIFHRHLA